MAWRFVARPRALSAAALMLLGGLALAHPAAAQAGPCGDLAAPGGFAQVAVRDARPVEADPAKGLPAFCEVTATISPAPGSHIGVVYRLPMPWNGKLVGYGGGGWAGNVGLETATPGLQKGYATAQTDGGHPSPNAGDTSWVLVDGRPDEVALADFSHRAVHQMTVAGKAIVLAYYGRVQTRAYFEGCSTGGRMALMEAQRYPEDYDAIIAGAPVYTLRVQAAEIWQDKLFGQAGAAISQAQAEALHRASLSACDALDGVKDGIVADPRLCRFDPAVLRCKAGPADDCLTDPELAAVRQAYRDVKAGGVTEAFGLNPGNEDAWSIFVDIAHKKPPRDLGIRAPMFGDAGFDFAAYDPARDAPKARARPFAREYEAGDPDIAAFLGRGGKLMLWHGVDDPGPNFRGTVEYYERVRDVTGAKLGRTKVDQAVRLFLAPGVHHCGGGPGPDRFDRLAALDAWVQTGAAPQEMLATKADGSIARQLCAYPAAAAYLGRGAVSEAANFVCRAPGRRTVVR